MPPTRSCLGRHEWVQLHSALLEEERKAEIMAAQTQVEELPLKVQESRGVVLTHLVLAERSTGLYGRPVVTLTPDRKDAALPANTFSAGDVVGLREAQRQVSEGVVTQVGQSCVTVVAEEGVEELDALPDNTLLTLHKLASDVTYRRVKAGLAELGQQVSGPASHLVSVLFGEAPPRSPAPSLAPQLTSPDGCLQLLNCHLDDSQREAVEFTLKRSDLAVIHGPPGTGKTTTLVEVIRQHIKLGSKVLVCAPSNLAVDNLVERLAAAKVRLVRLGHPARVTHMTQKYTLDAILHNSEEWQVLGDIRAEMQEELGRLRRTHGHQRHQLRTNIKGLRKELREKETRLVRQVLLGSEVILATLTSSGSDGPLKHLPPEHLDLVVIDECSQATEASCYLSLLRSPKLVLAGDHCQLPPTIVSPEAAAKGLDFTLMERVIGECGEEVVRMLTMQYRMHTTIMEWSSAALYHRRLKAHPSVASHLLAHLPGVSPTEDTESAAVVVDTAGCECWELDTPDHQSKANPSEAVLVSLHVRALVAAGVPEAAIAVITPYNLQVEMVRGVLTPHHPAVEVRSVDGFQGREKEAVVLSLVRSNKQGTVGFLSEDRRLNVAVTRARRHVALVCDSDTVGRHPFIRALLDHFLQHSLVKTAHEFQHELDTTEVKTPECLTWNTKTEKKTQTKKTESNNKGKDSPRNKKTKPKQQPSIEDNLRRRQEYLTIVHAFLKSSSLVHKFPPNLNSFERRLVHEICEELGLLHHSEGEGNDRCLVLKKEESGITNVQDRAEEGKVEEEELVLTTEKERRKDLEGIIAAFIDAPEETLNLSKLNAFERSVVHEVCEMWGLGHHSLGEGKKRHIVVQKPNKDKLHETCQEIVEETASSTADCTRPEDSTAQPKDVHSHSNPQSGAIPKSKPESYTVKKTRTRFVNGRYEEVVVGDESSGGRTRQCGVCGKEVPEHNFTIHSAQCGRRTEAQQSTTRSTKKENIKKKTAQKGHEKNASRRKQEAGDKEEDFDNIINKFVKENNTCSQLHCKASTTVIFQLCPFCHRTFCLTHHIAEAHGCGPLARQQARAVTIREGVLYPGSGVPSKKPSEIKRKQLERKLGKKMDEFSAKRTAKKKMGKDNKGKDLQ